jgi:hypothetical protein
MTNNPFGRPGLNERRLHADLYNALKEKDAEMAQDLGLDTDEVETSQKSRERDKIAEAIASVLYKHLTEYAKVIVPNHEKGTPAALPATDPAPGPQNHIHMITVPTKHNIGKLE